MPRAEELWREVRDGERLLCPSDTDESYGLVAAEARAAGTPIVALRSGALNEVVDDGVTGYLVEPGNIGQAAAAVGTSARSTGNCCRQRVNSLDLRLASAAAEPRLSVSAGIGGRLVDLPKHPVVHGHPVHAMLSDGPVILIPLAFAAERYGLNATQRLGRRLAMRSLRWPPPRPCLPRRSAGSTG